LSSLEAVCLQVHGKHKPETTFGVFRPALYEHHALPDVAKHSVVEIFAHRLVDSLDNGSVVLGEIRLGKNYSQRAWLLPYKLVQLVPIFGLASKLVAGDNSPLPHIRALLGHEQIRRFNYTHLNFLLVKILFYLFRRFKTDNL